MIIIASALLVTLIKNLKDLSQYKFSIDPGPLGLSFFMIIIMYFLASVIWNRILRDFGIKHNLITTARTYFLGLTGKYIPGKVWVAAIRVLHLDDRLRETHDKPPEKIVLSTVIIEHVYHLTSGFLFTSLAFDTNSTIGFPRIYGTTLALILSALVIFTPNLLIKFLCRLSRRPGIAPIVLPLGMSLKYFTSYFLLWILLSGAISVFVSGVLDQATASSLIMVGLAYSASVIIGFLVLPAPGGIGVREGSFVLLMSNVLSPSVAVLLGLTLRVLLISVEISGLLILFGVGQARDHIFKKTRANIG